MLDATGAWWCPTLFAGWGDAFGPLFRIGPMQACSSVAEHCHYKAEVGGSTPSAPNPIMCARLSFANTGTVMTVITRLACIAALVLLAGCAEERSPADIAADAAAAAAAAADVYVIGPGDQLNVFVYDSPQLSVERAGAPGRPDLHPAGPRNGGRRQDAEPAGPGPGRAAEGIYQGTECYRHRDRLRRPADRQIRVIGEATDPQAVPYRDHMTVLDLMIMTKGLTRYAAGNSAVIVRRVGDKAGNHPRAAERSAEGRRHQPERRAAARRHADHSANLVLRRAPAWTSSARCSAAIAWAPGAIAGSPSR